jgi:LL-diaminopimelate aminotransferase
MELSNRMNHFDAYLGTSMNLILTRMREEGKDVINLGLGDPDVIPPEDQTQALSAAVSKKDNHHYPSFYSPLPLKKAISRWYENEFGVTCDPESEVLPLLGSAEGIFHIHTALIDPGDIALVPDPCYPAYVASAIIAGGVVHRIPLHRQNGFLPDFESIDPKVAEKAKLIWVNYPNNPTAACAPPSFYKSLIEWAQKYKVAVISDNPYSHVTFENYKTPSFLQFEGAREIGVELNSLSKTYNCCGWRLGMMLGNEKLIAAVSKIKSHSDRGIFYPLQLAAIEALKGPKDFMQDRNNMFQERRDTVVKALKEVGIQVEKPKASFYIWATLPTGISNSQKWCLDVLKSISVWMIPGAMYGQHGEGYFRIALTHPNSRLDEAMQRLVNYIS